MLRKDLINKVKRIVVKVGTNLITTERGRIDDAKITNVVNQLSDIYKQKYEVLLVSSGAIASGIEALGLKTIPNSIPELQASASVGQGQLVHKYSELFKQKDINVGQVLLTQHDAMHRQQYVNAKNTLNKLLELNIIPIINENDSTAVDEIKFGDNDTLAALVANISEADLLVILSDIDGLYSKDPKSNVAHFISVVEKIDKDIEAGASVSSTMFGRGGMETKIRAAKMATAGSTGVIIANGNKADILSQIMKGEQVGTFFKPSQKKISARKIWILNQRVKGAILIDVGAGGAIIKGGKSLLAAGVLDAEKSFDIGDVIDVNLVGNDGPIAKGITNYSSQEIKLIAGKKHEEIVKLLNGEASQEVIHRNDMVVLEN